MIQEIKYRIRTVKKEGVLQYCGEFATIPKLDHWDRMTIYHTDKEQIKKYIDAHYQENVYPETIEEYIPKSES